MFVLLNVDGLVSNNLVFRYNVEHTQDGLVGEEGTFSICTFWAVEAAARLGMYRKEYLEKGRLMFEQMLGYANHLGLYSEEIGKRGEHLGNFPQAFTHLALISAAINLDRALNAHRSGGNFVSITTSNQYNSSMYGSDSGQINYGGASSTPYINIGLSPQQSVNSSTSSANKKANQATANVHHINISPTLSTLSDDIPRHNTGCDYESIEQPSNIGGCPETANIHKPYESFH